MDLERLDARAIKKVSGLAWKEIRPVFERVNNALVHVAPNTKGELTTIYVKYIGPATNFQPYAVVWVKKASEITIGLALPDDVDSPHFVEEPPGCKYAGLTRYRSDVPMIRVILDALRRTGFYQPKTWSNTAGQRL